MGLFEDLTNQREQLAARYEAVAKPQADALTRKKEQAEALLAPALQALRILQNKKLLTFTGPHVGRADLSRTPKSLDPNETQAVVAIRTNLLLAASSPPHDHRTFTHPECHAYKFDGAFTAFKPDVQ